MSKLEEVRRKVAEKSRIMTPPAKVEDLSYIEDEIDEACELHKRMKDKAFTDTRWESTTLGMLAPLKQVCDKCVMCPLGKEINTRVFSNMNPSKWMVVGQNSDISNKILEENGINRNFFYVTDVVKCSVDKPDCLAMKRCEPFLKMEFQILKPHLVVALGDVAFDMLIPGVSIKPHSGKMIVSDKFDVKVFPIDINNEKKFIKGLTKLCKIMKKF